MRYVIRADDLENILARSLDNVRRLGLSVSRLSIDVRGEEAALDLQVTGVTGATGASARTLGERIALIEGVRPARSGGGRAFGDDGKPFDSNCILDTI